MKELLKMVLSLSLSGSLLILALLAARPLVKGRLSSRWRYYIWLVRSEEHTSELQSH